MTLTRSDKQFYSVMSNLFGDIRLVQGQIMLIINVRKTYIEMLVLSTKNMTHVKPQM